MTLSKNILNILQTLFGYPNFLGKQQKIIENLIEGNSSFVIMPTGSGKSLCFQIPSLIRSGFGLVISPLIALMNDQVQSLNQIGIQAEAIHSHSDKDEIKNTMIKMVKGQIDLVYVSPERLGMESFLSLLKKCNIALFAIDEAHCISQWGHDFRPDYVRLTVLAESFPHVPRIALTATADEATRKDILLKLCLQNGQTFISSFDRPNIHYSLQAENFSFAKNKLLSFIYQHSGESGIVYCPTRKKVDDVATWFNEQGLKAYSYHAGLSNDERERNQNIFIKEENIIMVATIAFGMGIDKPNVRFVAHLGLPKSIESYYQETGRAGRDGLPAKAWLAYSLSDISLISGFIERSDAVEYQKTIEHQKLNSLVGLAETGICRRQILLEYFGEESQPCNNCDNCDQPMEMFDATEAVQKAISCVYRTGERFGVNHLVDVLMGKKTEKVLKFANHKIKTFGVGKERSKKEWRGIFRQIILKQLLWPDPDSYGGLKITEKGWLFLKQKSNLLLKKLPNFVSSKIDSKTKTKQNYQTIGELSELEQVIFADLKKKRLELAQVENLPPYIIFHDRTLLEMVKAQPKSISSLSSIFGVGEKKIEKYGQEFIKILEQHF